MIKSTLKEREIRYDYDPKTHRFYFVDLVDERRISVNKNKELSFFMTHLEVSVRQLGGFNLVYEPGLAQILNLEDSIFS